MKTRVIALKLTKSPQLAVAIDVAAAEARQSPPDWIKAQLRAILAAAGKITAEEQQKAAA